jgi:subtilisin family serine protease
MTKVKLLGMVTLMMLLYVSCAVLPEYKLFDCDDPDNFPPTSNGKVKVTKSQDPVPGSYIIEFSQQHLAKTMLIEGPVAETQKQRDVMARSTLASQGKALGGKNVVALGVINAFAANFSADSIKELSRTAASKGIVAISESTKVSIPPLDVDAADVGTQKLSCDHSWSQDRVNQRPNELDCNFDQIGYGEGIHVGLIDTGIDDENEDFAGRMGMCETAIVDPPDAFGCRDDHGHGTHVAGSMAGTHWGIAKQSSIHSCRALQNGNGADWQIILCIDKHILNYRDLGSPPYIVNESLGGSYSDASDRANCRMIKAGILNVVAAGNVDQSLCHSSPARVLQAVTVGATHYDDSRTYFSSHDGDAPDCKGGLDLWAPGWNVVSAKRGGCPPENCPWMSGTSMAAPQVAGAAAVYWGLNPDWDQFQVIDAMKAVASPVVTDSRSESNLLVFVGSE